MSPELRFQEGSPPARGSYPSAERATHVVVRLIMADGRSIPYRLRLGHELRYSDVHATRLNQFLDDAGGIIGLVALPDGFLG